MSTEKKALMLQGHEHYEHQWGENLKNACDLVEIYKQEDNNSIERHSKNKKGLN